MEMNAETLAEQSAEQEIKHYPISYATYSPEDNKIRMYPNGRLDDETYQRVKKAGFIWAPKQELWVAPTWTPGRQDLAVELSGHDLEDDGVHAEERAKARAERFEQYAKNRARDAEAASKVADQISERFWGGQPILIGHHSEKRARKDQERIHQNMRKAVSQWETSAYWESRAKGAIAWAKYREKPSVRMRRIKKLESDLRRVQRDVKHLANMLAFWSGNVTRAAALAITGSGAADADRWGYKDASGEVVYGTWSALESGKVSVDEIKAQRLRAIPKNLAYYERWVAHYQLRIGYETEMLGPDLAAKMKEKPKRAPLAPIMNRPDAEVKMTKAEYAKIPKDYRGLRKIRDAKGAVLYRTRRALMPGCKSCEVFLTDVKPAMPEGGAQ